MILRLLQNKNFINNLYSLAGNAFQAVLGFITFLILVRFMDQSNFGKWVIFITVATLMDMFRLGLTGTATIRLISLNKEKLNKEALGASYQLSLITTTITILLFWSIYLINPQQEYGYIFMFYPVIAICNIPFYQATIVFQGASDFPKLSILKLINASLIIGFLSFSLLWKSSIELSFAIGIYAVANLLTSLIVRLRRWDGANCLKKGSRAYRKEILNFGKYSTASYIGSNLLKSSDTLILGLCPFFGAEAVAIYAIPFKFVEMIEVVLRSLASTAYPKLSQTLKEEGVKFFSYLFNYISISTILFIPIAFTFILFPETLLNILGGNNYHKEIEIQIHIMYILSAYILFLPADRFTGVALFALNKAKLNFIKISIMLMFNIIFDLIAVYIFKSLELVALATLLFTFIGLLVGWRYVKRIAQADKDLRNNFDINILYNRKQLMKWIRP